MDGTVKKDASNNQHDLGAIDMKVMIPGGWNSQSWLVKGALAM